MEMNTRLQVEHPVTEAITGVDLVELQLRVAAGEHLPIDQQTLLTRGPQGHSFEARLYAENTRRNFLPGAGKVLRWRVPSSAGTFDHTAAIRVDSGVTEGDNVGVDYDPMIAKIVTHAADRTSALQLLQQALAETQVAGLPTNLAFLQDLSAHPAFEELDLDTGFIERHRQTLLAAETAPPFVAALAAALWSKLTASSATEGRAENHSKPGGAFAAWQLGDSKRLWYKLTKPLSVKFAEADQALDLQLTYLDQAGFEVKVDASAPAVSVQHLQITNSDDWSAEVDGQQLRGNVLLHSHAGEQIITLWLNGRSYEFRKAIPVWSKDAHATAAHGQLTSPMPGKVVKVLVIEGQAVEKGQGLVVVEAMKMEHTLTAHTSGVVEGLTGLHVGTQVEDGQVLLRVTQPADRAETQAATAAAAGAA